MRRALLAPFSEELDELDVLVVSEEGSEVESPLGSVVLPVSLAIVFDVASLASMTKKSLGTQNDDSSAADIKDEHQGKAVIMVLKSSNGKLIVLTASNSDDSSLIVWSPTMYWTMSSGNCILLESIYWRYVV